MELFSQLSNSVYIRLFLLSFTKEESVSLKEGLQIRGCRELDRPLSSCPRPLPFLVSLRSGEARADSLQEEAAFVVWAISIIMHLGDPLLHTNSKLTQCVL